MRATLSVAVLLLAAACSPAPEETPDTSVEVQPPPAAAPAAPAAPMTTVMLTEADARTRIEAAGYTNITGLTQAADGTWRATATRNGQTTTVNVNDAGVTVVTTP